MRSAGSEGGSVWECSSIAGDPSRRVAKGKAQVWKGSGIIVDYGQVIQIESYRETGTAL
jgi:hypothetical protein